jgi:hypothetical protein
MVSVVPPAPALYDFQSKELFSAFPPPINIINQFLFVNGNAVSFPRGRNLICKCFINELHPTKGHAHSH